MTKCTETIDLEDAILEKHKAENRRKAERRKAPKVSTSVLLPPHLKRLKNSEIVERIQEWLDSVDPLKLLQNVLEARLEAVKACRKAKREEPSSAAAIYPGFNPLVFRARGTQLKTGPSEVMSESKKTVTLTTEMQGLLIDVAVDLGVTFGEAVRIALMQSYMHLDDVAEHYAGEPPRLRDGKVSAHRDYRASLILKREAQEQSAKQLAAALTDRT